MFYSFSSLFPGGGHLLQSLRRRCPSFISDNTDNMIKQTASALLMLLLLLSAVFVGKAWAGGHFKSMETLRAYLESYGGWGPLILTMIQALQVVLPVLPGFLGIIVGAAMFGAAGVLLAIPAVAILDFLYTDYILPRPEARKQQPVT